MTSGTPQEPTRSARNALVRVLDAAEASDATLTVLRWDARQGGEQTSAQVADCRSFAALCDALKARRDPGRALGDQKHRDVRRHFDALTRDGVLVEHALPECAECWTTWPCGTVLALDVEDPR